MLLRGEPHDHRHLLPLRRGVDGLARRDGELAEASIADTLPARVSSRDHLTLHADRGTSMTWEPVAQLLVDLGIRRRSRPQRSPTTTRSKRPTSRPLSIPRGSRAASAPSRTARSFCADFFEHYNHVSRPPGSGCTRRRTFTTAPPPRSTSKRAGPSTPPTPPTPPGSTIPSYAAEAAHRRLDQRTVSRRAHRIRIGSCLKGLDSSRIAAAVDTNLVDGVGEGRFRLATKDAGSSTVSTTMLSVAM